MAAGSEPAVLSVCFRVHTLASHSVAPSGGKLLGLSTNTRASTLQVFTFSVTDPPKQALLRRLLHLWTTAKPERAESDAAIEVGDEAAPELDEFEVTRIDRHPFANAGEDTGAHSRGQRESEISTNPIFGASVAQRRAQSEAKDYTLQQEWENDIRALPANVSVPELLGEWYRRFRYPIYGYAHYFVRSREVATDVVHDAIASALAKGMDNPRYLEPHEQLPKKMRGYVQNTARNHARKLKNRARLLERHLRDDSDFADEHARSYAMKLALAQVLDQLDPIHRDVLLDYHYLGLTGKEIADKHRISPSMAHRLRIGAEQRAADLLKDDTNNRGAK